MTEYDKTNARPFSAPPFFLASPLLGKEDAAGLLGVIDNFYFEALTARECIDTDFPQERSIPFEGTPKTSTPIGSTVFALSSIAMAAESSRSTMLFLQCMDQEGSRQLQKSIDTADLAGLQDIAADLAKNVVALSTDLFGNYVVQRMVEQLVAKGGAEAAEALTRPVLGSLKPLATDMYGCRVVQKVIENRLNLAAVLDELRPDLIELIEGQNSNHVIQKVIECAPRDARQDFWDEMFAAIGRSAIYLAKHRYGCRVLQKLLDSPHGASTIPVIVQHTEALVCDQFGNYVIQHVLEQDTSLARGCLAKIADKIFVFSTHKFASNVVEKLVLREPDFVIDRMLALVDGTPIIVRLACDKFGNYVVQKLLEGKCKFRAIRFLREHVAELRKSNYAKHILGKL